MARLVCLRLALWAWDALLAKISLLVEILLNKGEPVEAEKKKKTPVRGGRRRLNGYKGICCENLKTWNSHKGGSRELIILSLSLSPFPFSLCSKTKHWTCMLEQSTSVCSRNDSSPSRENFILLSSPLGELSFFLQGEWRVWPLHGITESLWLGSNEKERWAPWRRWRYRVF